jgi:hypothetical protein
MELGYFPGLKLKSGMELGFDLVPQHDSRMKMMTIAEYLIQKMKLFSW